MASILRQRRDSAANWASNDPVIPDGQFVFDTTNNQYRMGNGIDNYSALPLQSGTPGADGADGTDGVDGVDGTISGLLGTDLDCNGFTVNKGAVRQIAAASPADAATHTFDFTAGDMQQVTCPATGTITFAFSGFPAGDVAGFTIDLVNAGNCVVNFPAGITYSNGTVPTYTIVGTDRLLLMKDANEVYSISVIGYDIKTVV